MTDTIIAKRLLRDAVNAMVGVETLCMALEAEGHVEMARRVRNFPGADRLRLTTVDAAEWFCDADSTSTEGT